MTDYSNVPLRTRRQSSSCCADVGRRTAHFLTPCFRFSGEQVWRTTDDRAFDWSATGDAFGFAPRSFEDGLRLQLERMDVSVGVER